MPAPALTWDLFCRVIDNHGDLGVSWRLARGLAARGQQVRLWVDDASALAWMAPGALEGGVPGIEVLAWEQAQDARRLATLARADVWIEAFGCELPPAFVAWGARQAAPPPVWLNLEYLSAEPWTLRMHGLPSPVQRGPAAGWTKWFFYPGFGAGTGGLLREPELPARQAAFDRAAWLAVQGVAWHGEMLLSLFCYEPPPLAALLQQLQSAPAPSHLLVTAGRAAQAVQAALGGGELPGQARHGQLRLTRLPLLPQPAYDELLWACDLNFVRGEDSLVRALWAGQGFVWQPYPQHDGAHRAKLAAFLDWLAAPPALRAMHAVWSGLEAAPLPSLDPSAWRAVARAARERLCAEPDLVTQLLGFVHEKIVK
ncbi:MAG TPA: elongation factor P maturation arginine rhamnosyltransferase EarP [Ottowia sp.]|uniref:elongation factor P maturation arginine rhamnosyltransferase EarP n=1 Tax=Ottowia sp. TaxID=1898956 RepID=UPI002CF1F30A|nr:elongation factor P maturation arginine rhamnosyltransferase EarP [Ottowia sp.]HMN21062.1 elongation factor P maturation arginine rhamnosyltransferase EarP [Ottowia sp.]